MIVLDTNVVSELMRAEPMSVLLTWLDAQDPSDLWLNAVVAAELMFGVARLADGKRNQPLAQAVSVLLEQDFAGRVLSFDLAAAAEYATLAAERDRIGLPMAMAMVMADAQIAAICRVNGAILATRNRKHFEGMGLSLIDPWD